MKLYLSFNTVNGKGCCNVNGVQASSFSLKLRFNTVNGKGCCNQNLKTAKMRLLVCFNTVNGKGCCNFR